MLTFAFTFLVLIVYGVAGYFAFQSVKKDFEAKYKRLLTLFRLNAATGNKKIRALEEQVAGLLASADREQTTIKPPSNPFTRSEERHLADAKKLKDVIGIG